MLALAAALFLFLAGHTVAHLDVILGWDVPRRITKLAMGGLSLGAGIFAAGLLFRDVRGRPVPIGDALKPAWLVVGADLIHAYFQHGLLVFLIPGLGALLMGGWGAASLARSLRRST